MCLTFLFIIVLQTTIIIGGPQSKPEQFLVKVLDDRYLRSPVMILVEGCSKTVYRFEHICSKINQLPNDVTLAIATYNSSGLGPTIETAGIYEIQNDIINYLKISTHRIRCKPEFGVFTAIRQAADVIPYDSEIVLITSHPPSDPELQLTTLQTLIQKRCKLQVLWLEKSEVPGKYYESAQRTGGEVYEVDAYEWPFDKQTNNKSEELKAHNTTEEFFNEDLFNPPQKVMIAVKRGVQDILSLPILVDSSMSEIYITTTGSVHKASLRLPNGLLKELSTGNTTIISTDKQLGVWQLEAVGHNFNITVQALSRLKYSAFVEQRNITAPDNSGKNVGLVRLHGEGKLDEVVLVDEMGKELTKFEQVQNSYEEEGNKKIEDLASDNTDNDSISEWQIPADQLQNKHYYIQVVGQDSRGDKFTRLSSLRVGNNNLLQPVTVELNELSQIIATPGQTINLYYDVSNNYYQPIDMIFYTQDNLNFIRDIVPKRQVVLPQTKIQVNVILEIQTTSSQTTDVVTMTAQSYLGPITAKTYLYIGYQRTDSDRPSITYTTDGYCRDTLSPSVCYSNWWSVDAVIQDDSGLIRVQSLPNGLQYKSEFIAGTKDKVYVHYTSNCCNTKVDIIASDVNGNVRTRTIDIERVWLTAGEITAIVLGVLLAIIIIILIIVLICICVRRRRNRNFLMHQ